jgi:hypothetical protein
VGGWGAFGPHLRPVYCAWHVEQADGGRLDGDATRLLVIAAVEVAQLSHLVIGEGGQATRLYEGRFVPGRGRSARGGEGVAWDAQEAVAWARRGARYSRALAPPLASLLLLLTRHHPSLPPLLPLRSRLKRSLIRGPVLLGPHHFRVDEAVRCYQMVRQRCLSVIDVRHDAHVADAVLCIMARSRFGAKRAGASGGGRERGAAGRGADVDSRAGSVTAGRRRGGPELFAGRGGCT